MARTFFEVAATFQIQLIAWISDGLMWNLRVRTLPGSSQSCRAVRRLEQVLGVATRVDQMTWRGQRRKIRSRRNVAWWLGLSPTEPFSIGDDRLSNGCHRSGLRSEGSDPPLQSRSSSRRSCFVLTLGVREFTRVKTLPDEATHRQPHPSVAAHVYSPPPAQRPPISDIRKRQGTVECREIQRWERSRAMTQSGSTQASRALS